MIAALLEVGSGALVLIALGGIVWLFANAIEQRRYLRRRLRLVKPRRSGVVIRFVRRAS